jgi:hypothetical protein
MSYVEQRLAEIRSQSTAEDREKETLAALKEVHKKPSKDDLEWESMQRAPVGYVYFIRSGNLVKIGFSADVASRLTNIRVGCAMGARLVAAIPGTEDTETYFHKLFEGNKEHGEWFRIEGLLADVLKRLPTTVTLPERKLKRKASEISL